MQQRIHMQLKHLRGACTRGCTRLIGSRSQRESVTPRNGCMRCGHRRSSLLHVSREPCDASLRRPADGLHDRYAVVRCSYQSARQLCRSSGHLSDFCVHISHSVCSSCCAVDASKLPCAHCHSRARVRGHLRFVAVPSWPKTLLQSRQRKESSRGQHQHFGTG